MKSRKIAFSRCAELMGAIKNAYNILVKYSEEQTPFGRHRHRWEGNSIKDIKLMGMAAP
jgi:hypothetical protein